MKHYLLKTTFSGNALLISVGDVLSYEVCKSRRMSNGESDEGNMVGSHPFSSFIPTPQPSIYKALLGGSTGACTALCAGAAGATKRRRGAGLRSSKACAAAVAAARRAVAPSRVAWARAATVAAPLEPARRAVRRSCNLRILWPKILEGEGF